MGNCWPKPVESLPSGLKPPSSPVPPPENSKDAKRQPHQPTSRNKSPRGVHNVDDHHLEGGGAAASRAKGASSNPSGGGSGHGNKNEGKIMTSPNLKMFTYAELRSATRNFRPDTVLGEGGFGRVFKGWVDEKTYAPSSKVGVGIPVAVKKSNPDSEQGLNEWQAEVNFLGKFSHPNLVRLLGYCWEDKEFLLVYEHMQRGSLESHLFRRGAETLSWETRLKIAVGAARGLEFLHTTEKQVIYRDFKASNILLDTEFNAKLSDFGLAKLGPINGNSHVTTQVVGTLGYAAPEYMATGHLYVKSDVYGFGVVLLEIISGRRVIDLNQPTGEHNLVDWAKPLLPEKRKLRLVIDPQLEGQYPLRAAMPIAELILKCLEHDPKKRPSMQQVLGTLEQIHSIKMRPKDKDRSTAQHKRKDVQRQTNHRQNYNKHNSASAIGGPDHPMLPVTRSY